MFVVLTGKLIHIWNTQKDATNEDSTVKNLKFTETKMRLALY